MENISQTFSNFPAHAALPGAGPRVAIGLAIGEFTIGALWLYRLPKQMNARIERRETALQRDR